MVGNSIAFCSSPVGLIKILHTCNMAYNQTPNNFEFMHQVRFPTPSTLSGAAPNSGLGANAATSRARPTPSMNYR